MVEDDSARTIHAQEALKFSDVFAFKFQKLSFGSPVVRKLKLSEPEMSTDGGRKARQPIVLAPEREGRSLVLGWVDVPRKVAELKSYTLQSEQFEQRYGAERMDITREEYDRAVQEVTAFFRVQQIETTVVQLPARAPSKDKVVAPEAPRTSPIGLMIAMLAIGIAIGFGLGYLVFHLRPGGY